MTAHVVETHTATLWFEDGVVRKRKKPLDLGFLDFRSLEARRLACAEEVRLNRRLAPDVYLAAEPVLDEHGQVVDHEVVMRALPADRALSALVATGVEVSSALDAVARQLAALHARSPAGPERHDLGAVPWQRHLWDVGLDALRGHESLVPEDERETARELAHGWLMGRAPLLTSRLEAGRLVEGHGDLQADDVFVLDDGPRVLDCLEFDTSLRVMDGVADACFLVMDLERLGAPALAKGFLDAYLAAAVDAAPPSFVHHHVAYRAHVRAKVTCVRARQAPSPLLAEQARALSALALRHLRLGRARLVVVGGLPGSGKTTVAAGIAQALGAVHLSSDLTRKHLAGLPPEAAAGTAPGAGRYGRAARALTYQSLLAEAEALLGHGRNVVLDATFSDGDWREAARGVARRTSSELQELRCSLEAGLADARLRSRTGSASDATPEVRRWLADRESPWPEAIDLDTGGAVEPTLRRAEEMLVGAGQRPSARTKP